MAEWSKAVDLSPTISGCAGSNPAWRIIFYIHINNNFRAIINYLTNQPISFYSCVFPYKFPSSICFCIIFFYLLRDIYYLFINYSNYL